MKNTIIIIFLIWIVTTSCTISNFFEKEKDYAAISYKKDLNITINGRPYEGIGVLEKQKDLIIRIESRVDINMINIETCHRDVTIFDIIDTSWIKPKQTYEYKLILDEVEMEKPDCSINIFTYNKTNEDNNADAFFTFNHYQFTVPAQVLCNGSELEFSGSSVCNAKVSKPQRIKFKNPMVFDKSEMSCPVRDLNTMSFDVEARLGNCTVVFMDMTNGKKHKFTLIGYNLTRIKTK